MTTQPDEKELAVKARLIALIDGTGTTAPQSTTGAVDAATAAAVAQPGAATRPQPDSPADPDGWWDALYADGSQDTHSTDNGETEAPGPDAQPHGRLDRRRIQPWWTGRPVDFTPDNEEAAAEPENTSTTDIVDKVDDENDEADAAAQPKKLHQRLHRIRIRIPHGYVTDSAARPEALVAAPAPRMSLIDAYTNVPRRIRWLALHGSAAAVGYKLGWVQFSTRTAAWIADNGWLNISSAFWAGCGISCELLRRRMRNRHLTIRWLAAVPISSIITGTLLYGTGWQNLELPL
ncbi:hypothetical protein [Streptomyces cavernae]|uniref:hypothetical protein n=1 Tax=Streptomyces cavernae TaxID=2259034 RepID=UPI000FEB6DE7|nr:hypothetical protein [Streptomyces cavernae]